MKRFHCNHATLASENTHSAEQEVGEGHGRRLFQSNSKGLKSVECGQKSSICTTLKKQRGKDLAKPKMSAYEKIRERNFAEREKVLADLEIDFSQTKTNLEIEEDEETGKRNADS